MKKHVSHFAIFVVLLALLAGCVPIDDQSPTGPIVLSDGLLSLLETVNAEHQAIVKAEIEEAAIVERWARDPFRYSLDYQIAGSMIDGVLTAQQAKNDVNVLFYELQTKYGLYEYFGGDEIFDAAKEAILQACDEAGTLTPDELSDILSANLVFVRDAHFNLEGQNATLVLPFHYRAVAFEKTGNGYQTLGDKRQISSVEDYADLDTLFRRSISTEGAIVYYPVVLAEISIRDFMANPTFTPKDLVVRFTDGTSQVLIAEVFKSVQSSEGSAIAMYKNRGTTVLFSGYMGFDEAGDQEAQLFLDYAEQLKSEPVMILDLRSNHGGNSVLPHKWLHAYFGKNVTSNSYAIGYNIAQPGGKFYVSDKNQSEFLEKRNIGGGITLLGGQPDEFVENENLIIVLIGNGTASAAEAMVDLLHNVSNVLFIGDLTYGCYVGMGSAAALKLPFSQISVSFGNGLRIFPEGDYFQEMRGFFPDLWVPAAQAEELAIKLLLNSK